MPADTAKSLRKAGPSSENLRNALSELSGETSAWPTDEQFSAAWQSRAIYEEQNNAKLVHMLRRISNEFLTNMNETITVACPLSVEHILPQSWLDNWPLSDGSKGLTERELYDAEPNDPKATATVRRNAAIQMIGNLTIVTQALNSSVSNSAWTVKKPALLNASLLPINQQLHKYTAWDEEAIERRSKELLQRAIRIWPAPSSQAAN